ncbi:MAG: hypothetical protein AAF230_07990 [Pseudomonadota bacterium]
MTRYFASLVALSLAMASPLIAQSGDAPAAPDAKAEAPTVEQPMTMALMGAIVLSLDPDARVGPRGMQFSIDRMPVTIIADPGANRMRILVPIASATGLSDADLMRLMQANFDTALDARYAVAQNRLWSVYIHPLAQLERSQFVSGVAQTVTLARNYGSSYASGGVVFGGGDSGALYQELLDKSEEI